MAESILTASIIRYVRREGCYTIKLHGGLYGVAGMADLLILVPVKYQVWPSAHA